MGGKSKKTPVSGVWKPGGRGRPPQSVRLAQAAARVGVKPPAATEVPGAPAQGGGADLPGPAPRTKPLDAGSKAHRAGGVRRGTWEEAVAILSEPEKRVSPARPAGEGARILFLANSRAGKTSCMRAFLQSADRDCLTFVHDVKEADPQYRGHARAAVSLDGVPDDASCVVFHGDPYAGAMPDPDAVAALALAHARARVPVRLVVDELSRACTVGGRELSAPAVVEAYLQGGGMGLTVLASNQIPQRTPTIPRDQATAIVLGPLGRAALNYLDGVLFFDPEMLDAVEGLQVGEIVIHIPGVPWNRTIYTFPLVK